MKVFSNKTLKLLVSTFILAGCVAQSSAEAEGNTKSNPQTTVTETVDEIGEKTLKVKVKRDEGLEVHPSNKFTTTKNEFYCKGYKVETVIVDRSENLETISIDFDMYLNGEKVNLKPIIGSSTNLFGNDRIETNFACVDNIVRVNVSGQTITTENTLAPESSIIDLLIDRKTNTIESNL